jgi:hypothetical protein
MRIVNVLSIAEVRVLIGRLKWRGNDRVSDPDKEGQYKDDGNVMSGSFFGHDSFVLQTLLSHPACKVLACRVTLYQCLPR